MNIPMIRGSVELVGGNAEELGHRIECFLQALACRQGTLLQIRERGGGRRITARATLTFQVPLEHRSRMSRA